MMRDTFEGKRYYVARFGGLSVAFKSYWAPGTFGLGSDAISACNLAGAPASLGEWDELAIEGPFLTRWAAAKATRSEPDPLANAKVADNPEDLEASPDGRRDEVETGWEADAASAWDAHSTWADAEDDGSIEAIGGNDDAPGNEGEKDGADDAGRASGDEPGESNLNEELAAHIAQTSDKLRERLMRK